MTTSCSLHLICYEIPRLKGVGHAPGTHTDSIADTNGTKLVSDNTCVCQTLLDFLTKAQKMTVASSRMKTRTQISIRDLEL